MPAASTATKPVSVFVSYSHLDKSHFEKIQSVLRALKREGLIDPWTDREIVAGGEWSKAIHTSLQSAELILLLVSRNFMESDYCFSVELKYALKQHRAKKSVVLPIIIKSADWGTAPFRRFQALPDRGKAIDKWPSREEAYASISKGLRKTIEQILKRRTSSGDPASTRPITTQPKSSENQPPKSPDRSNVGPTASYETRHLERRFEQDAETCGVKADELIVYREVTSEGHATTRYSVRNLILTTVPEINGYKFRCDSTTGILGRVLEDDDAVRRNCRWNPEIIEEAPSMEERIASKTRLSGEFEFRPPLRPTTRPISWGWAISVQYSDATSDREYYRMYSKAEQINLDGSDLIHPGEYYAAAVAFPVRRITLQLKLPKNYPGRPALQIFKPRNLSKNFKPVEDNRLSHNLPKGTTWEMDRVADEKVPTRESDIWSVSVDYPDVFSAYSLLWGLPSLKRRETRLEIRAEQLRHKLCELAVDLGSETSSSPLYDAIAAATRALYNMFEAEYRGDRNKRFDVSFMTYDDVAKRLVIVHGIRNGLAFPEIYRSFRLPIGMGTAGNCYKIGKHIHYTNPPIYERGTVQYLSGGEVEHGVLLSVPIDHPEYRQAVRGHLQSGSIRRWQLVGVFNIGCEDKGSPLLDLDGTKRSSQEKRQEIQEFCQEALNPVLERIQDT